MLPECYINKRIESKKRLEENCCFLGLKCVWKKFAFNNKIEALDVSMNSLIFVSFLMSTNWKQSE